MTRKKAKINRWKANQTAPVDGTIQVDQSELRWLAFLREELRDLSLLPEVIRHWRLTGAGSVKVTSIDDAVNRYISYREGNTANQRTLNDICWRLREFGREFSEREMHQNTAAEISDYLEGSPKTKKETPRQKPGDVELAKERRRAGKMAQKQASLGRPRSQNRRASLGR